MKAAKALWAPTIGVDLPPSSQTSGGPEKCSCRNQRHHEVPGSINSNHSKERWYGHPLARLPILDTSGDSEGTQ